MISHGLTKKGLGRDGIMILYCLNQRRGTRPLRILETYDNVSFKSISALSQKRTSPISFGG
jgi:hypothetical protein